MPTIEGLSIQFPEDSPYRAVQISQSLRQQDGRWRFIVYCQECGATEETTQPTEEDCAADIGLRLGWAYGQWGWYCPLHTAAAT